MEEWQAWVYRVLASRGFHVESGVERIAGFTGTVARRYVLAVRSGVKVRVVEVSSGMYNVSVLVTGSGASESLAGAFERLGGSVDLEDGVRLYAAFKKLRREGLAGVLGGLP